MNPDNEAAPDASLDPIAEHFQQLSHRMEQLAQGLADGMARLESRMEAIGAQMLALESRTDVLASLVSAVETRLSTLELRQTPSAPAAGVQATAFATAESVQRRLDTMERQIGAVQSALTDLRFRFALSRSSASEAERRYTEFAKADQRLHREISRLDRRMDSLTDDVRQRFRGVNDRLAALAN